jgi:membrane protein implicated in regulation of membrane protease activity
MWASHTAGRQTRADLTNRDAAGSSAYASAVDAWLWWTVVAAILAIAEVLTLTFVLGMLAGGAAAAAVAAAAGASNVWQYVVFAVVDVALLGGLLPVARRHRKLPSKVRTGAARHIGERVMSITPITTASGGRVQINGEAWTARPDIDGYVIPEGQWVNVVRIDGATAIVHPTTEPTS